MNPLRLIAACAVFLLAAAAHAEGVVTDKSEIAFTVKQMGVKFDGRFRKWSADILFRPQALAQSRAQIDVDLGSVDLASEDSEAEARGRTWFDVARFPVAHFVSSAIRDVGGGRYEVAGRLTMKGMTRDCVVPIVVKADPQGQRIAEGTFSLKRLDYKVGEGEWADPSVVDNDVLVRVRMVLAPPS
jgi:polyisoprenoid-binding protein YceI